MDDYREPFLPQRPPILVRVLEPEPPPPRRRWVLAASLFLLTCATTFLVGGPVYAAAVMTILTTHELGHFLQARRYGVVASLPYFIPMPLPPLGTMGAIIAMGSRIPHRRALFDIGASGPLAGLVPAIACAVVGIQRSTVQPIPQGEPNLWFGEPLLFQLLSRLIHGPIPDDQALFLHPLAFAGWVGIFITALNLTPIGQLDGGHVLYAMLGRRAHAVAIALLGAAIVAVIAGRYWHWSLILVLLIVFGPRHPPTADDRWPLDRRRWLLGWLTLAFLVLGFTPTPWTVELP
ncbi:MAG: site-2 protease family protein [Acidobacteria bacterium]|nr:MAG: site-2 protease family protein [Acidobacteriota bacterium]